MTRYTGIGVFVLGCILAGGCEEEPLPPSDAAQAPQPLSAVDERFTATVEADRPLIFKQVALVVQPDPLDRGSMGVSLTTVKPGPDGSHLILGTFASADSMAQLAKKDVHFSASSFFDPAGSGMFTGVVAYQPKLVILKITSFNENTVQGTFGGEFYRFSIAVPTRRPDVIQAEASFTAALIVK